MQPFKKNLQIHHADSCPIISNTIIKYLWLGKGINFRKMI